MSKFATFFTEDTVCELSKKPISSTHSHHTAWFAHRFSWLYILYVYMQMSADAEKVYNNSLYVHGTIKQLRVHLLY